VEATTFAPSTQAGVRSPQPVDDQAVFTPAMLAELEADVLAVGRVIDAIRENTYGTCEFCATEIAHDDIRQNPLTFYCHDHRNSANRPAPTE
jgi:RNA polymerase-binding transcription factor DksA